MLVHIFAVWPRPVPPHRIKLDRLYTLNDGSKLRITGLNSAFVSSHTDTEGSLFVDPASFTLTDEYSVSHLVFCHHPYTWLANGQELADHLGDISHVHLFDHEHTNRIELNRDWVRVAASAAHPDRTERGWEPGYNLLQLSISREHGRERRLNVKVHVRIWQNGPGKFTAKKDKGDEDYFYQSIRLEPWGPPVERSREQTAVGPVGAIDPDTSEDTEEDASMTAHNKLHRRTCRWSFMLRCGHSNRCTDRPTPVYRFK